MGKAKSVEAFTVTIGAREFQCERIIEGTRIFTQRIRVLGIGSKNDSARYGAGQHPIQSMKGIAKLIAGELISESASKEPLT